MGRIPEVAKANVISQDHLEKLLRTIFPKENIVHNGRKSGEVRNPETGGYLEIDFSIQKLNLNFEFQDAHHYVSTWYYQVPLHYVEHRDILKKRLVERRGETLIAVPCWWEADLKSLIGEIHFARPDIFDSLSLPSLSSLSSLIPLNPPPDFFRTHTVSDVGSLMLASFPPPSFSDVILPSSSWWLGEKYDGIRACWNSVKSILYTRHAVELFLPDPLTKLLCSLNLFVDGEIWFGRGNYAQAQILVSSPIEIITWPFLRFIAFDEPAPHNRQLPFEERYSILLNNMFHEKMPMVLAPRIECTKRTELQKFTKTILQFGGEGVILQKRESLYESGRSTSLLKLKAAKADMEALVVDVTPAGYLLKLPNSVHFTLPLNRTSTNFSTDLPNDFSIQPGDVVTVSILGKWSSKASPVGATISRIRRDLDWNFITKQKRLCDDLDPNIDLGLCDDLITNNEPPHLNSQSSDAIRLQFQKRQSNVKNPRSILENFAERKGFDPLVVSNWYQFPEKLRVLANKIRTTPVALLKKCFPSISYELDPTKLISVQKKQFETSGRREELTKFAKKRGMDSMQPVTWYILHKIAWHDRETAGILRNCGKNPAQALMKIFPDINLNRSLFYDFWEKKKAREKRNIFEMYAMAKGFDPLIPWDWYSESVSSILPFKGMKWAISGYGSHQKALVHLFPEIGLDPSLFHNHSKLYWEDIQNRRSFFDRIAISKGLDPLDPQTWYNPDFSNSAHKFPGIRSILDHYDSSLVNALLHTYPNLNLVPENFPVMQRGYWSQSENRRKHFIKFAQQHNFDPLVASNWYSVPHKNFVEFQRMESVMAYHKRRVSVALVELFPEIGLDLNLFHPSKTKN